MKLMHPFKSYRSENQKCDNRDTDDPDNSDDDNMEGVMIILWRPCFPGNTKIK